MTKKEAIALEALCEKYLDEEIEGGVEISMNLAGRLKIRLLPCEEFVAVSRMLDEVVYVSWNGSYRELQRTIRNILRCISEHLEDFVKLLWSYENRSLLTGDDTDET